MKYLPFTALIFAGYNWRNIYATYEVLQAFHRSGALKKQAAGEITKEESHALVMAYLKKREMCSR